MNLDTYLCCACWKVRPGTALTWFWEGLLPRCWITGWWSPQEERHYHPTGRTPWNKEIAHGRSYEDLPGR